VGGDVAVEASLLVGEALLLVSETERLVGEIGHLGSDVRRREEKVEEGEEERVNHSEVTPVAREGPSHHIINEIDRRNRKIVHLRRPGGKDRDRDVGDKIGQRRKTRRHSRRRALRPPYMMNNGRNCISRGEDLEKTANGESDGEETIRKDIT